MPTGLSSVSEHRKWWPREILGCPLAGWLELDGALSEQDKEAIGFHDCVRQAFLRSKARVGLQRPGHSSGQAT